MDKSLHLPASGAFNFFSPMRLISLITDSLMVMVTRFLGAMYKHLKHITPHKFPRYCPRLTHNHIFEEMNVAKAAQVSKLLYNIKNFQDMALPRNK